MRAVLQNVDHFADQRILPDMTGTSIQFIGNRGERSPPERMPAARAGAGRAARRVWPPRGRHPQLLRRAASARAMRSPLDPPQAAGQVTRRADSPLPHSYPIGLADQRKPDVKVSLIIVNG